MNEISQLSDVFARNTIATFLAVLVLAVFGLFWLLLRAKDKQLEMALRSCRPGHEHRPVLSRREKKALVAELVAAREKESTDAR